MSRVLFTVLSRIVFLTAAWQDPSQGGEPNIAPSLHLSSSVRWCFWRPQHLHQCAYHSILHFAFLKWPHSSEKVGPIRLTAFRSWVSKSNLRAFKAFYLNSYRVYDGPSCNMLPVPSFQPDRMRSEVLKYLSTMKELPEARNLRECFKVTCPQLTSWVNVM